jgi:hypothetical protein
MSNYKLDSAWLAPGRSRRAAGLPDLRGSRRDTDRLRGILPTGAPGLNQGAHRLEARDFVTLAANPL